MVPLSGLQDFRFVCLGKLAAGFTADLHLQLLAGKTQIAETQQTILLDTHDGIDTRIGREVADIYYGFERQGREAVYGSFAFICFKSGNPHITSRQVGCRGDGRRTSHEIIDRFGTVQ